MGPSEIIPVGNTLGEGVVWDAETQSLWWTDIHERRLHRYDWRTRKLDQFATPERLCSFGFIEGSTKLVAAFESGFAIYDPLNSTVAWLTRPTKGVSGIRFNDGRVDRQGRFWAGTMAEDEAKQRAGAGNLYCLDGTGQARIHQSGIAISNGICWSPDGARFYFADSPHRTIHVYDFDVARGAISGRRLFVTTPHGASPDGANVDAEGYLWSAHWGASCVVRYAPDGRIDRVLDVPTKQPTCVAFGGPDLDLLFVTSAREGLDADVLNGQPSAGHLFVYKTDVSGLPDGRYRFAGSSGTPDENHEASRAQPKSHS